MSVDLSTYERKMLGHAYVTLLNGYADLANYEIRDLEITRKAGYEDICWAAFRNYANRKEVRNIITMICVYATGSRGGALEIEREGIEAQLAIVSDTLAELMPGEIERPEDHRVINWLEDEHDRLERRLQQIKGQRI